MTSATSVSRKFEVSWDEIQRLSRALAWRLAEKQPKFHTVIAVARGGMVPALVIARELDIRLMDTICIATHDEENNRHDPKILKLLPGDGAGCIVVDDLVDKGVTFQTIRKYLPKAHFAAIYAKPEGCQYADSYMMELSQQTWVRFPWEVEKD